jgi:hypothetical protein
MKLLIENVDDPINQFLIDLDLFSSYVCESLYIVNVQVCMPSSIKFIVNLEDPGVDVEIVCDQFGKLKHELLLVIDIYCTYGVGNICKSEDLLCSRLG